MATKAKESSQVKAKRGTSPSLPRNVDTTQRKKSLNPGTASPDQQKHCKTSSSSETTKPVPSYLRATKSSSLDPFKQQANKKPTSTAGTAQKPAALSRRRSFDKPPPSTSQVQKPGGTTTRERVLRSSSFTSTNNLSKPKTQFNDGGRPQSEILRRGNTKKTSTTTIQKQQRDVGTTSKLKSKTAHSPCTTAMNVAENVSPRFEVEPHQDDQESSVTDVGEDNSIVVNDESNNELPGNDILVLDDKDHVDMLDEVLESDESSEIKVCEASTLIFKDDKTKSPAVEGEEAEDEIPIKDKVNNIEEVEEEQNNIEQNENHKHPEEIFVSGSKGESTEISDQQVEETETDGNGKENALDEKEEADEGKVVESTKIPEQIVEVTADNHVKSEKNNSISAAKPQGGGQGNKKDLAAYNDVIEETATKLRQQRKNKVLALVGAFETVISLQDPES